MSVVMSGPGHLRAVTEPVVAARAPAGPRATSSHRTAPGASLAGPSVTLGQTQGSSCPVGAGRASGLTPRPDGLVSLSVGVPEAGKSRRKGGSATPTSSGSSSPRRTRKPRPGSRVAAVPGSSCSGSGRQPSGHPRVPPREARPRRSPSQAGFLLGGLGPGGQVGGACCGPGADRRPGACVCSIEYWFRCMDLDGDGALSMFELEYFYEEQCRRLDSMAIEALPFEDCLCQMLDLVKPQSEGGS